MVRKAVVKDLCDRCLDETSGDQEIEAEYCLVIMYNERHEIAIDLCVNHAEGMTVREMITAAHTVLREPTQQTTPRKKQPKVPCQFCHEYYSAGSGMALHIKSAHREESNKHKVIAN